jgi:hypothetical protein
MAALIIGFVFIALAVFAVIPAGLGWWTELLIVLKGGIPLAVLLVGLVTFFVGLADIKDKKHRKKLKADQKAARESAE